MLRDPIRRAEALLANRGVPVGEESGQKADPTFLMEMMEQREALSDARRAADLAAVDKLAAKVRAAEKEALAKLSRDFAEANGGGGRSGAESLAQSLGELRYYRRFLDEVAAIEDELG